MTLVTQRKVGDGGTMGHVGEVSVGDDDQR